MWRILRSAFHPGLLRYDFARIYGMHQQQSAAVLFAAELHTDYITCCRLTATHTTS